MDACVTGIRYCRMVGNCLTLAFYIPLYLGSPPSPLNPGKTHTCGDNSCSNVIAGFWFTARQIALLLASPKRPQPQDSPYMARSRRHFACPCIGAASMCMSALNKLLNLLPLVKNGPSHSRRSRATKRWNCFCNTLNSGACGVPESPAQHLLTNQFLLFTIYYLPPSIYHLLVKLAGPLSNFGTTDLAMFALIWLWQLWHFGI